MRVKIGLRIPAFPVDGRNAKIFVTQIHTFLRGLEKYYDSAWVCDHFVPWATFENPATPTLEGFTTISYLAGVFDKLTFGNIVLCNSYRNPVLLAKMGATLQALTRGRFVLGIGAGWKGDEYLAYGYEFPSPATRIRQLEEAVQIIRRMWTEETVTFQGRYYQVNDAYCHPKPFPLPPIMIGGGGEQLTLRVVARHADWWNLANPNLETYERKLDILGDHCTREGRDPSQIVKTLGHLVAIANTTDDAMRIARRSPFVKKGEENAYLIGTPADVHERLETFIQRGVTHFILRFLDFPKMEGAQLFAEQVIPELQ